MKWYDKSVAKMHRDSMTYLPRRTREQDHVLYSILKYIPSVVLRRSREYPSIGILDLNDLISIGNVEAIDAYNRVNWEWVNNTPKEERPAMIWAYVKKSVKLKTGNAINIDKDGIRSHMRNGLYKVERGNYKTEKNPEGKGLTHTEDFKTQLYMAIEMIYKVPADTGKMQDIEDLAVGLSIVMDKFLSFDETKLLNIYYGLDGFEKQSLKSLQDYFKKNNNAIKKMKQRAVEKLRNDEAKKILQNFYVF